MCHLRWNGQPSLTFFTDSDFADFKGTLDAKMKRLQSARAGSKKRQVEVLTEEDEEQLWQKGLLGDATPQTLVDTMAFTNLFCEVAKSTNNWDLLLAGLRSHKKEKNHTGTSNTQRRYKISPKGTAWMKK